MGIEQVPRRYAFQKLALNDQRCFSNGQASAVGYPEYMRIDRKGRLTKSGIQYDVGGFTTDTGQSFQCLAVGGYGALVFLQQGLAGCDDIFCLGIKQADGLDIGF